MSLLPNQTMLFMWLIFFASYLALSNLVIKPTLPILAARKKRMSGQAGDAQAMQSQAAAKLKEYESMIAQARQQAREAREAILKTAETEVKNITTKARSVADQTLSQAQQDINAQVQTAKAQIGPMSQDLARQMVEKLFRKVA
jgi:F0F1-type ATP synthase membrane subunit b/b'